LSFSDQKLLALSKIENLNSVIFCLNDKGLTPKFLGLPIETLQDPKLIKQAFGINFEIEMKKPAKTEPVQTMEFSDFSSPRSSPNI